MEDIRKTLEYFIKCNGFVEIRHLNNGFTKTGYFKEVDNALKYIKANENEGIFYFVFNKIKNECYAREQQEHLIRAKATTSDNDIERRKFILIDLDCKRASNISSTDEEKEKAHKKAQDIFRYLKKQGFSEPMVCDSGNGYHLLYRCDLENNDENKTLVKSFLEVISLYFSDESVDVDLSVFNAARITKLYGSMARKGANDKERPHRQSKILSYGDENINSKELILKITGNIQKEEKQVNYKNNIDNEFDLDNWLLKYNISITKKVETTQATRYELECCPFDNSHKGKDAMIFRYSNGGMHFKCFHNSCSHRTWKDLRLLFEPNAYDEKEYTRDYNKSTKELPQKKELVITKDEATNNFKKFKSIERKNRSSIVTIKSGITTLDKKIHGFDFGRLSVWSGLNGSGKSAFLSQMVVESIWQGYNVALYSGELQDYSIKNNLCSLYAGKNYMKENVKYGYYYLEDKNKIIEAENFFEDKLFLYDNNIEDANNSERILKSIEQVIINNNVKIVILDNLMSMSLGDYNNLNNAQSEFVKKLSFMVKKYQVHIHFVCHPRKTVGFLRKTDIAGTADLTNLADNVFIVHRNNIDFKNQTKAMFGWKEDNIVYDYDNVLEVCKNREDGIQDCFIGLYFEPSTKRFLNEKHEYKDYSIKYSTPF